MTKEKAKGVRVRVTAKHPNSVPPQIVYPPGPIERQANTVPRGMLFGGGGVICPGY